MLRQGVVNFPHTARLGVLDFYEILTRENRKSEASAGHRNAGLAPVH